MSFLHSVIDKYFIKNPRFRRFVTAFLEADENEVIDVVGTTLCINRRREHGYLRASKICKSSSLLRDEVPVLINLASVLTRCGGTFLDVGANVGMFTHTFSRLQKILPTLKTIAFEPHPSTFQRLSNVPDGSIQYFNCAVGDFDGEDTFVDGAVSHVFTRSSSQNSYNISSEQQTITVHRLDSLDLGEGPFVMKIDVEGQELNVLRGASRLLSEGRIKAIYIDGFDDDGIVKLLREHGFVFRNGRTLEETPDGRVFSLLALAADLY